MNPAVLNYLEENHEFDLNFGAERDFAPRTNFERETCYHFAINFVAVRGSGADLS